MKPGKIYVKDKTCILFSLFQDVEFIVATGCNNINILNVSVMATLLSAYQVHKNINWKYIKCTDSDLKCSNNNYKLHVHV